MLMRLMYFIDMSIGVIERCTFWLSNNGVFLVYSKWSICHHHILPENIKLIITSRIICILALSPTLSTFTAYPNNSISFVFWCLFLLWLGLLFPCKINNYIGTENISYLYRKPTVLCKYSSIVSYKYSCTISCTCIEYFGVQSLWLCSVS